jgi:histidinol dehydrogenase
VRVERRALEARGDATALARELHALTPVPEAVVERAREIIARVRVGGDDAVAELTHRLDAPDAGLRPLRVDQTELDAALAALDTVVGTGLELAIANVRAVAEAGLDEQREVRLAQGQRVVLREQPVRRAAVYVPGGRAPYPSTVVMGVATARVAGVDEVVVCAPPGRDGDVAPAVLAACALAGADEVYRMGGAQAIAALAYGTESVAAVDVIVGPGNDYVQTAKREVAGAVGIDGFAGPSDVLIVFEAASDVPLVALDLLAQAEHGTGSLVIAVSPERTALDALAGELDAAGDDGSCVLIETATLDDALRVSEAFAPEHLELIGAGAEALAPRVRSAGCVFVGRGGATAFGDYVAGSNHVLPTGGAARFASGLSPRHFRRRMAEVHIDEDAAAGLAPAGASIARAEGFERHAQSIEARIRDNGAR